MVIWMAFLLDTMLLGMMLLDTMLTEIELDMMLIALDELMEIELDLVMEMQL